MVRQHPAHRLLSPLEGELVIPTRRIQKTDGRIPLILDVMRRFKAAKPDIAMYGLVCGRSPSPRTCAGPTSLWICTTMRTA